MDGMKCILQLRGVRPFLSEKYDITKHRNYRHLSDANPRNAFNIGRFVKRTLKVRLDEQYRFIEYAQPFAHILACYTCLFVTICDVHTCLFVIAMLCYSQYYI